jgi:hypothetical protein
MIGLLESNYKYNTSIHIERVTKHHGIGTDAAAPLLRPDVEFDGAPVSLSSALEAAEDPAEPVLDADGGVAVPVDPFPPSLDRVEAAPRLLVTADLLCASAVESPVSYADAVSSSSPKEAPVNAAALKLPSSRVTIPSISVKAMEVSSPFFKLLTCTPSLPTETTISPTVCAGSPFSIVVLTLKTRDPPAVDIVKAPPLPRPTTVPTPFWAGSPKVIDDVPPADTMVKTPEERWNVVLPMTAEPDGAMVVGDWITRP